MRTGQQQNAVPHRYIAANVDLGAEVKQAVDIDPASFSNHQRAVHVAFENDGGRAGHHRTATDLESDQPEDKRAYSTANVEGKECEQRPCNDQTQVKAGKFLAQQL